MEQDTEVTKVIFRQFKDGKHEVIAFFPELCGGHLPNTCSSYLHVGQHGAADCQAIVRGTRLAHPSNYADLKAELESIGYKLQVCYRFTRKHYETRRAALKSMEVPRG